MGWVIAFHIRSLLLVPSSLLLLLEFENLNPFVPNVPFLYHLKTSENLTVFCLQGVEKACTGNEWGKKSRAIHHLKPKACNCNLQPWSLLKPATLLKASLLHEYFSRFQNCTDGSKSRKASHIYQINWKTSSNACFLFLRYFILEHKKTKNFLPLVS